MIDALHVPGQKPIPLAHASGCVVDATTVFDNRQESEMTIERAIKNGTKRPSRGSTERQDIITRTVVRYCVDVGRHQAQSGGRAVRALYHYADIRVLHEKLVVALQHLFSGT